MENKKRCSWLNLNNETYVKYHDEEWGQPLYDDKKLYELVAPLVMSPEVLKQNYNYPFRTSEEYEWFVALDNKHVVGFVPVEHKKYECVINNYYIKERNVDTLKLLLEKVLEKQGEESSLTAVSFVEDRDVFSELGFLEDKVWTRYVKMKKNR